MSVSAYSSVFMGFRVTKEDFICTEEAAIATCPRGHSQLKGAKFCQEDGGRFDKRPTFKARPALHCIGLQKGGESAEELFNRILENGDPLRSYRGASSTSYYVLGQSLSFVSYYDSVACFSEAKLEEVRQKVLNLRMAVGMSERPIEIFHRCTMS
jgi:hypothetical protein